MTMLFVNPNRQKCGVYQFGLQAFEAIRELGFSYTEDLTSVPRNGVYLFNWHPGTNLAVLNAANLQTLGGISMGTLHDPYHDPPFFRIKLRLDPTFADAPPYFGLPRILDDFQFTDTAPSRVTVGSWGFGLGHKNYQRVITLVESQLQGALIRLHIPYSDWCDAQGAGARTIAEECKRLARSNDVEVSHDYMSFGDFVKWAHGNSVNIFTCAENISAGISSCTDIALMAKRPIGVSKSMMYKHIFSERTCIERTSLTAMIEGGQAHLDEFRRMWTPQTFREKIRLALSTV